MGTTDSLKISITGLLILLTSLVNIPAHSQQNNAGSTYFVSYPESGSWYAMDDSNTGFFLNVQNGVMAGAYFGFDAQGDNVWMLFNGPLVPVFGDNDPPELQTGWQLDSVLTQASNGGCILNCVSQNTESRQVEVVGTISFEFTGRSIGEFRVDGGERVPIIPLYFGVSALNETINIPREEDDGAISSQPVLFTHPDLEGTWAVAIGNETVDIEGNVIESKLAANAGIIETGPQEVVMSGPPAGLPVIITFTTNTPIIRDTTGLFNEDSVLSCAYVIFPFFEGMEAGGFCGIDNFNRDYFGPTDTFIYIHGTISLQSDSRFVMHINSFDADRNPLRPIERIEAFRVGYN